MDAINNREFGHTITRVINRESLSREESYQAFSMILQNSISEMQQGAFLAALTAKGETIDEIAGGWQAVYDIDTQKVDISTSNFLVDNCGTGMDSFKTFNISTAASVIGAAGGLQIARHGARAISSKCGTVDIAESLGVDVDCSVELTAKSIEQTGLGLFNGMSPEVHPFALGRILSQISFGSPLNIAASLANPAMPRRAVRGVYSREMLLPVVHVMKEIGYENALVIHGAIDSEQKGIDEASVCGSTYGYHLVHGDIVSIEFTPEEIGLKRHSPEAIRAHDSADTSASHLVRILAGKEIQACEDIVVLNSGLLFLIADMVPSVADGIALSRELVSNGKALKTLEKWVGTQNRNPEKGINILNTILEEI